MKKLTVFLLVTTLLATALVAVFRAGSVRARDAQHQAEREQRRLEAELKAAEDQLALAGQPGEGTGRIDEEVYKSRIAALVQSLGDKDAELENLRAQARAARNASDAPEREDRGRNPDAEDWRQQQRERMDQLREEDPDAYARIQQERRDLREQVTDNLGGQVEFITALNLEGRTQEQLDNHATLLDRLSAFREKVNQFDADSTGAEGDVSRRALFQEFREIAPLLEQERQVVLYDLAMDLGYAPEDATSFVEYVDYVNEMTSPRAIMRGLGGGRRNRGP